MSLYKSFENLVLHLGDKLLLKKLQYSEWRSIFRKRNMYANVKWSVEQDKEFEDFFSKHYGKKFSTRWHKLYESMNGTFCAQYFPEILFSTKLEIMLNSRTYSEVFGDKSLLKVIYGPDGEKYRFIKDYITDCNGLIRTGDFKAVTFSQAIEICCNAGPVCVKPTVESGGGKGVRFLNLSNGRDITSGEELGEILKKYKKNFTIQERLKQHDTFANLHPQSINTIRLITYILDNKIWHVPLAMRLGSGGSSVDNIHAGGLCVGVRDDGTLLDMAYRLGYGDDDKKYTVHPDTGITFEGYHLAHIPDMIKTAEILHSKTSQIGIISWDFTVDEVGKIVVIEANTFNQSIWFPQIVNKSPAFGENTARMLELIRK